MAKIDFKENGSNRVENLDNPTHGQKEQARANYFGDVSTRPLERLGHLVQQHGCGFSDSDLMGFQDALQCEAYQVRELISTLSDVYGDAPCLDNAQKIDAYELHYHYQSLHSALSTAMDALSKLSDLGLVSSYASTQLASRLRALKNGNGVSQSTN